MGTHPPDNNNNKTNRLYELTICNKAYQTMRTLLAFLFVTALLVGSSLGQPSRQRVEDPSFSEQLILGEYSLLRAAQVLHVAMGILERTEAFSAETKRADTQSLRARVVPILSLTRRLDGSVT